jgi:hypothetical protein
MPENNGKPQMNLPFSNAPENNRGSLKWTYPVKYKNLNPNFLNKPVSNV